MMSQRPSWGFVFWYAWTDLFETQARPTSRIILSAVALATAAAWVGLATPFVMHDLRRAALNRDPTATCIEVSDPSTRVGGRDMTAARVEAIRQAALARLPSPEALRGCFGFAEVQRNFAPLGSGTQRDFYGRIIHPGDPIDDRIPALLQRPGAAAGAYRPGLVVTRRLLRALRLSDEQIRSAVERSTTDRPFEIELIGPSGQPVPLGVRGVLDLPFGQDHDFLLPEADDLAARSVGVVDALVAVRSGPLPGDWPQPAVGQRLNSYLLGLGGPYLEALPPGVQKFCAGVGVELKLVSRDRWVWELTKKPYLGKQDPVPVERWREYLLQLSRLMQEARFAAAPAEFAVPQADGPATRKNSPPPAVADNWATVYVSDVIHLREVVAALEPLGLELDSGAIPQLEQIERDVATATKVLYVLVLLFTLAVSFSLYHLLNLRAERKAAETGMLCAMGIERGCLLRIWSVQALVLWLLGVLLAVPLAASLLGIFLLSGAVEASELMAAVSFGPWVLYPAGFVVVALVCLTLGTWRAGRRTSSGSPIHALNLSS